MRKIFWKLLKIFDDNWGYTTPLQERFCIGEKCRISPYKLNKTKLEIDEVVYIVETGRHDYLVKNESGIMSVVYQFELIRI